MLDYPSEVSLWMVGMKKLIHELINLNEAKKVQACDENIQLTDNETVCN